MTDRRSFFKSLALLCGSVFIPKLRAAELMTTTFETPYYEADLLKCGKFISKFVYAVNPQSGIGGTTISFDGKNSLQIPMPYAMSDKNHVAV